MTVSSITINPMISRVSQMRSLLDTLQEQLTTGKVSDTYGGLGSGRSLSINFNSRINQLDSYSSAIDQVGMRVTLLDTAMTRLDALPEDVTAALDPNNYQVRLNGQTDGQTTTSLALDEMVSLLNTKADGRYLMSGATTDTKPVLSTDAILNGSGGKSGLKQVIADRWTADAGEGSAADGYTGRLGFTSTVSLSTPTDVDSTEAAYSVDGVASGSAGIAVSGTDLTFSDGVVDGDTVDVTVSDPDGNPVTLTLTARTAATATGAAGEFIIGGTTAATASAFQDALDTAVGGLTYATTDGLGNPITQTGAVGATATVNVDRANISDVFGFKIAGATSTSNRITTANTESGGIVTGTGFTFSDTVTDGDTVTFTLTNPDSTQSTITLKATSSTTPSSGEFSIGANGTATAANFQAALETAVKTTAATDLKAASAVQASKEFFSTTGGKTAGRVDTTSGGGTLATATALTYDTTDSTIQWYQGYNAAIDATDASTLPRNDITARIDDGLTVGYGVRANEEGYATMMAALAVMSSETFDTSSDTDEARYTALTERVRSMLAFEDSGTSSPESIHSEVAVVGNLAKGVSERQTANKSTYQELLDGVEGVDKNQVAAQILTLQNNIEASYQTTSMLSQLTLVNFL